MVKECLHRGAYCHTLLDLFRFTEVPGFVCFELLAGIGIKLAENIFVCATDINPPVRLSCSIQRIMHGPLTTTGQSDPRIFNKYE